MELRIRAEAVVQLEWTSWNAVCEIHAGLVNRDNPGKFSHEYHDLAGNVRDDGKSFQQLVIPAMISAVRLNGQPQEQIAYHGDWIVRLADGFLLVIPGVPGMVLSVEHGGGNEDESLILEKPFVFDPAEFPRFSRWRHTSGNIYVITGHANVKGPRKGKYPPEIRYANYHTNEQYNRLASDWHRSMTRIPDVF